MSRFEFTNTWFEDTARRVWDQLIMPANPRKILEIGSFEGASTCYLIEKLASLHPIEIHCIDTWEGGLEHKAGGVAESDMSAVEGRFKRNTEIAMESASHPVELVVHKGFSHIELSKLIASGKAGYFDFVYVDGSHQAPDVLCDAVLGFHLLRVDGILAFDDYLWAEMLPHGKDPIRSPKIAIDAFTNIYCRKINIPSAPLYQLYVHKTSD